jgi:hypothetical protein
MNSKAKLLLIVVAILAIAYLFYCGLFYAETAYDKWRQPWAYGDEAEKLLVGKWTGNYTDPDRKTHTLQIEIFAPQTAEERWKEVTNRHRGRSYKNPNAFDGIGYIITQQKADTMKLVSGHLDKAEPATNMDFDIAPIIDDNYPVGFQLAFVKGNWTGEKLDLKGEFVYHTPSGSGYSDSADPRFDYVASFVMERMK